MRTYKISYNRDSDHYARLPDGRLDTQAHLASWDKWIDGIPVIKEVYELATAIRNSYPNVQFFPPSNEVSGALTTYTSDGTKVLHFTAKDNTTIIRYKLFVMLSVGLPNQLHSMATIGFGGFQKAGTSEMYMVYSRTIRNEKYNSGNYQFHMRMTTNLKTAVKNALKHMIPYSVVEAAAVESNHFFDRSSLASVEKKVIFKNLCDTIDSSSLLNEVRALKAAGVKFTTPAFIKFAEQCEEAAQLFNAERGKRVDALFVSVVKGIDGMELHWVEANDIRTHTFSPREPHNQGVYKLEDVPQFIQEKVAVLQTLDEDSHVDGVGMKVCDTMFWVEK